MGVLRAFHTFLERAEPAARTGEEALGSLPAPCVCRGSELVELLELPGTQALLGAFLCGLALLPVLDLLGILGFLGIMFPQTLIGNQFVK